jgi:hypothetical protein
MLPTGAVHRRNWGYDWNVKAGEAIRILDVTDGASRERRVSSG